VVCDENSAEQRRRGGLGTAFQTPKQTYYGKSPKDPSANNSDAIWRDKEHNAQIMCLFG